MGYRNTECLIHVHTCICIRYLLVSDVFFFVGVDFTCALLSTHCHNFTASAACYSHGNFFGFTLQKQCQNDFVNCTYGRDGNCYTYMNKTDCDTCPNVTANLSTTVVEFHISNDTSCTINISATDIQGKISNSSAVESAKCKFMYTCIPICLLICMRVYQQYSSLCR